ncbi:MAG: XrtA/PEP-CTERM system-associated ATPase [Burkholderiales bacterium]
MYEAFYGLNGKPFQLNPDPEFFFASRGHARAYAYLQYGLYQSEGFIVVTGEVGAGKTTLVRSLLKRLDPNKVVAAQIVTTQLDAEDLLKAVATAFGVPARTPDKAQLLANLEAFFVSLVPERKRALLVVDEAQNLTARAVEELRMLSNFQLENRALLQSFLVGQPELRQVLHSGQLQQLRQRVIASYHLGPMDRPETQAYIEHRLKHVGWSGDPALDAGAFEAIFAASGGIPRRVNLICNRVLLAGYLGEKHQLAAADVRAVANEIQRELGPETVTNPNAPAAAAAPAVNLPVPIGQIRATESDFAKLEERVTRLERLLHSTVGLVHTLIERENQARGARKG